MLCKVILYFLTFVDILGFNTGSSKFSQRREIINFIYIVHFILATILTFFNFYLFLKYYPLLGIIQAISEFLQYLLAICTYWWIIFDSIIHCHTHRRFWIFFQKIDTIFHRQLNNYFRFFFIKFHIFFLIEILLIMTRYFCKNFSIVNFAYAYLFRMCQFRIFYYLFCLEVIQFQLNIIQTKLKLLEYNVSNFKWIREYFHHVYEMLNFLNEIFGWSHVAAIFLCFYLILSQWHWVYLHYLSPGYFMRVGNFANNV